jgi:hypothetical protein
MKLSTKNIEVLNSIESYIDSQEAARKIFQMCLRKKKYATVEEAKEQCKKKEKEIKYYMKYYSCPICKSIHIARDLDRMWKKCKKTP